MPSPCFSRTIVGSSLSRGTPSSPVWPPATTLIFPNRHCAFRVFQSSSTLNHRCGMAHVNGMPAREMQALYYLSGGRETTACGCKVLVFCSVYNCESRSRVLMCMSIIHICRRPAFRSKAKIITGYNYSQDITLLHGRTGNTHTSESTSISQETFGLLTSASKQASVRS